MRPLAYLEMPLERGMGQWAFNQAGDRVLVRGGMTEGGGIRRRVEQRSTSRPSEGEGRGDSLGGGGGLDFVKKNYCLSQCGPSSDNEGSREHPSGQCFWGCMYQSQAPPQAPPSETASAQAELFRAQAESARAQAESARALAQAEIEKAKIAAAAEGEKLKLEAERIKAEIAKAQIPQQIVTSPPPMPAPAPAPPRETPEEEAARMRIIVASIRAESAWPWWYYAAIAGVVGVGLYLYTQKSGGKRRAAPALA